MTDQAGEVVKYPIASKTLVVVCLACSALLLLSAGNVQAQELVAAKILSVEGPVEIRRPANNQLQLQQIVFKSAAELRTGDTIIIGRKGRLVLSLADGSQAVSAAQTNIVIKDLSQSPRTRFHVLHGKTRVQIKKLGGRNCNSGARWCVLQWGLLESRWANAGAQLRSPNDCDHNPRRGLKSPDESRNAQSFVA